MRYFFFTIAFFFLSQWSSGQNTYQVVLNHQVKTNNSEKVYLHLDRPNYGAGDRIWFKAYVLDGAFHQPTTTSGTLYVDLIDLTNETVIESLLLPIKNGTSAGSILLKKNLKPGSYRLRSYTNWMRNFDPAIIYRKDITIWAGESGSKTIDKRQSQDRESILVDFFPEGGDLIDGISTKVAIKINDPAGNSRASEGTIVDQEGNEITTFKTNSLGHGLCFFRPSLATSYFASIGSNQYALPPVKRRGAAIRINHHPKSPVLSITVQSNGIDLQGGELIAHQRSKFLFGVTSQESNAFSVKIKKSQLPAGIIQVTFFTKERIAISERLVFPNMPIAASQLTIEADQESYKKRSRVTLHFSLPKDTVLSSSVTINHKYENAYPNYGENLVSYLLLSSDLKGKIETPHYYFSDSATAYKDLDLLMMTQGWSRFNWESALNQEDQSKAFLPESGITIRGEVRDFFNKDKARQANIGITVPSAGIFDLGGMTDENGSFAMMGNEFYDSTRVILSAYGFKKKKDKKDEYVSIMLKELPPVPLLPREQPALLTNQEFIKKQEKLNQIARAYNLNPDATLLDEVVITTRSRKLEELEKRTTLYLEPSNRIVMDSLNFALGSQSVVEILSTLPGVFRNGNSVNVRGATSLSSSTEPLFLVDGIVFDDINLIPVQDIEVIDVLKGADASVYGTRGANGVILIYTRKGSDYVPDTESKGVYAFDHPGYHQSKEFYSPQYDVPDESHAIPDYRSTLFWEPELTFTNGAAFLEFYTSDQPGVYRVLMEGMLTDGSPFTKEVELSVE